MGKGMTGCLGGEVELMDLLHWDRVALRGVTQILWDGHRGWRVWETVGTPVAGYCREHHKSHNKLGNRNGYSWPGQRPLETPTRSLCCELRKKE